MEKAVSRVPFTLGGIALILLVLAVFAYVPLGAQPTSFGPEPTKELDEKVKLFFDDILNGNASKAFNELLRASSGNETLSGMKTKLDDVKTQFGEFREYEKIDTHAIGKDLVVVRYLLKCDKYPVIWTFTFYRCPLGAGALSTTPSQWFVVGLRFDTNLDMLTLINH